MGPGSEALQVRPECLLNTREVLGSHWGFWSARAMLRNQHGRDGADETESLSGGGPVHLEKQPANGNRNSFSERFSLLCLGPLGLLGLSQPWAVDVFT